MSQRTHALRVLGVVRMRRSFSWGQLMVSRHSLPAVIGVLTAALTLLGACATDATFVKPGEHRTIVVPSNYRQLVAHYIAANVDRGKVLKAEISRPGVWDRADFVGGPRPIACARWTAQGPIIQQTYSVGFMFENGKISESFYPENINPGAGGAFGALLKNAATCGNLAYVPFPELMKTKAAAK